MQEALGCVVDEHDVAVPLAENDDADRQALDDDGELFQLGGVPERERAHFDAPRAPSLPSACIIKITPRAPSSPPTRGIRFTRSLT